MNIDFSYRLSVTPMTFGCYCWQKVDSNFLFIFYFLLSIVEFGSLAGGRLRILHLTPWIHFCTNANGQSYDVTTVVNVMHLFTTFDRKNREMSTQQHVYKLVWQTIISLIDLDDHCACTRC
jgi:hypothetical protein